MDINSNANVANDCRSIADVELTNVSVGQRLVQGQGAAVRWHGGDGAFFCLPRVVAGGGDADLVSNLHTQQTHERTGKQTSESSHALAVSELASMWKADLPVDGLRQGQGVGSSGSSGSQFGVVNVVRLSIKLQSTKHTCGTTQLIMKHVTRVKRLWSMIHL